MNDQLFVLGDGDSIRMKIERLLFSGEFESLTKFSNSLNTTIQNIADKAVFNNSAKIIFAGGDDILFKINVENFDKSVVDEMISEFYLKTGVTISFGVGFTIEDAYINLRRAKARGGNRIVTDVNLPTYQQTT